MYAGGVHHGHPSNALANCVCGKAQGSRLQEEARQYCGEQHLYCSPLCMLSTRLLDLVSCHHSITRSLPKLHCELQESGSHAASELGSESTSAGELTKQQARHANELADVKKKFMAVARRKQQDYNKKVCVHNKHLRHIEPLRACQKTALAGYDLASSFQRCVHVIHVSIVRSRCLCLLTVEHTVIVICNHHSKVVCHKTASCLCWNDCTWLACADQ